MMLYFFTQAPYSSHTAREGVEAALAAAAFDQPIAVVFMNHGVYQLLQGQQPDAIKNLEKLISAFPVYGVDKVYVSKACLEERNLATEQLLADITPLAPNEIQALMAEARHILSF